jgi:NAD(P)-dependent dehydrogenase (short-subunit alcohol dehydrogenase family)
MNEHRTAVVTGGTSGLGEAASVALAKVGFRVLIVGRDPRRGQAVVQRITGAGGAAEFVTADLFSVNGARALGRELLARAPKLDLLVNNAGGTFGNKELTPDGLERTFALNVMAPFELTETLRPALAAAKGRVVNVVTGVPKNAKATIDQLAGEASSSGLQSYVRAKLALLALTREQQRRFAADGITAVCLHPGIIPGTRFGQDTPAFVRAIMEKVARVFGLASSLEEAAARYITVGTGPVEGGGFYKEGALAPAPLQASDAAFGSTLWTTLEAVHGRAARPSA